MTRDVPVLLLLILASAGALAAPATAATGGAPVAASPLALGGASAASANRALACAAVPLAGAVAPGQALAGSRAALAAALERADNSAAAPERAAALTRTLDLPALALDAELAALRETTAPHLLWQLRVLGEQLRASFAPGPQQRLRVTLVERGDEGGERIDRIALLDSGAVGQDRTEPPAVALPGSPALVRTALPASGRAAADGDAAPAERVLERVLERIEWREQPGGSALVSASGIDYERAFFVAPVEHTRISRGFGWVTPRAGAVRAQGGKPAARRGRAPLFHAGIDYAAPTGTPVHAVADARVAYAGRVRGFGNLVILDHGDGVQTYYAHLSAFPGRMSPGQSVTRGMVIGKVGSTGRSTGPHLHFEVRRNGRHLDALDPGFMLALTGSAPVATAAGEAPSAPDTTVVCAAHEADAL